MMLSSTLIDIKKKMAEYRVLFKKSVQKDFNAIPKRDLTKTLDCIELLAEDPRPPGCEKLPGQQRYRLRQKRYRILYSIQDDELTVWIVKVGYRKEISIGPESKNKRI